MSRKNTIFPLTIGSSVEPMHTLILQDCTLSCMQFSDGSYQRNANLNFSIPYGTLHTRGLALMLCLLL